MADSSSPPTDPPSPPRPPSHISLGSTALTATPDFSRATTNAPSTGSSDLDPTPITPHTTANHLLTPPILQDTPGEQSSSLIELSSAKSPPLPIHDVLDSPPSRASRAFRHVSSPPLLYVHTDRDILPRPIEEITASILEAPGQDHSTSGSSLGAGSASNSSGRSSILHQAHDIETDITIHEFVSPRSSSPVSSSSPLAGRASHTSTPPESPASPDPITLPLHTSIVIADPETSSGRGTSSSPTSGSTGADETIASPPRTPTTYLSRKRTIRKEDSARAEDLIEELLQPDDEATPGTFDGESSDPRVKRRRHSEGSGSDADHDVFAPRTFPQRPSKLAKRYPSRPGASPFQQNRRTSGTSAYSGGAVKVRFISSSSSRLQSATSDAGPSTPTNTSTSKRPLSPKPIPLTSLSRLKITDSPRPPLRTLNRTTSALDDGLLLSSTSPRAVHVVNNASIKAGHTIAQLTPIHPTLHTRLLDSHCAGCLLDPRRKADSDRTDDHVVAGRFLQCGRCEMVWFCSLKCYAKNAHNHFDECRALVKIKHIPSAEVRVLAKACMDRANGRILAKADTLLPLTHYETLQLAPLMRDLVAFLSRVHRITAGRERLDYKAYGFAGNVDLFNFVRKIRQHIVPITDAKGIPLGLCLAPTISKFGHSCRPNAHLSWPYGMAAEKPLRVIAIDHIDGGEEIMISHVDLSIALYSRLDRLAIKGYTHECGWCERELKTTDVRWTARHMDCPDDGLVALKDDSPQGHPYRTDMVACDACGEIDPEAGLEEYDTLLESLEPYLQAEAEGAWLLDAKQSDKAITSELAFLEKAVDHLLNGYPDTVHPIPTLHRRLARIYLLNSNPTFDQIVRAIELLQSVYDAYYLMNLEEPRHITLSALVDQVDAHLKIIDMNSYNAQGWRGISIERKDNKKRELLLNQLDQAELLIREANIEATKLFGVGGGGLVIQLRRHKRRLGRYRKWYDENMDDGSSWDPEDEEVQTSQRKKMDRRWSVSNVREKDKEGTMERALEKENMGRKAVGSGRGVAVLSERKKNTDEPSGPMIEAQGVEDKENNVPDQGEQGQQGDVAKTTESRRSMDIVLEPPLGNRRRTY